MSATYWCPYCKNYFDAFIVHDCPESGKVLAATSEEQMIATLKTEKEELQRQLTVAMNDLAERNSLIKEISDNAVELKERNETLHKERTENYRLYKDAEKEVGFLRTSIQQLKSILFEKELIIAQNSGYIARVRETDPSQPEQAVEVPVSLVNVNRNHMAHGEFMNPMANASSAWGVRNWWNIGTVKEDKNL